MVLHAADEFVNPTPGQSGRAGTKCDIIAPLSEWFGRKSLPLIALGEMKLRLRAVIRFDHQDLVRRRGEPERDVRVEPMVIMMGK